MLERLVHMPSADDSETLCQLPQPQVASPDGMNHHAGDTDGSLGQPLPDGQQRLRSAAPPASVSALPTAR